MPRRIRWSPRVQIPHDSSAERIVEFDWNDDLQDDAVIASSTWHVSGPDGTLVMTNQSIASDGKSTLALRTGGTPGKTYTVMNRIETNEAPPQKDDKSIEIYVTEE